MAHVIESTDRPATKPTDEIEITRPMVRAGVSVLESSRGAYADEQMVVEVYKAMKFELDRDKYREVSD
jgi:hypothetical protein